MNNVKNNSSLFTKKLHRILLSLLILTVWAGYFPNPAAYAETGDIPVMKSFPASERVRSEVEFAFSYPHSNLHIVVTVKQTSFDTGEIITNSYDFEDPSLNSKYILGERPMSGSSVLTPTGPKSYVDVVAKLGSTLYEFDFNSKQLKKITDINNKFSVRVYGSLGIYETIHNELLAGYSSTDRHQLYSIQTNKAILPQGKYEIIERITPQKNAGSGPFETTDYLTVGKSLSDKGTDKYYLVSYGGKLTPIPTIYNKFNHDQSKKIYSLLMENGNGQLQMKDSIRSGQEFSTLTWIKGNTKKTLLEVPGYINEFSMPSFSPNNRYMIISSQVRGVHLAFVDATYYIFDLNTMTVIQKIKPHYKLYQYKIDWFSDVLFQISYDTSNPGVFSPVFYHIPTQTSTASRELLDFMSYLDNFTYEGLLSLNSPISLQVDDQYIRYSGNGPLVEKDTFYIPLLDFAGQQGITVNISATELQLSKGDKRTSVGVKNAKKIGSIWYVPLKELLPLGYGVLLASSHYIMLTVKDGES
ncbi:hypothetical protein [Paenibacillus monticola]|uniref:Uncharacterized protein n=1 Tax=Paenibacillus monticola TaxID=2666075 RepID=A0A7X2L3F0_9BACL|nr:hypothetical protein [Paenibacillus monticola]MRN55255.1 hypothetical protein [Paenibacillus monticola]